jgi:hypothetical protein
MEGNMATTASKIKRLQKHAEEKAAKKAAREMNAPSEQEIKASEQYEKMRNLPRGQWLNGKLFKNAHADRKSRPGESVLHAQGEQENHDRSVALKHTVEFHTTDPDAELPPHSGETKVTWQENDHEVQ